MKDEVRHVITIRLSSGEKAAVDAAAKEVGLPVSTWMRTISLAAAKKIVGTKSVTRQ